MSSAVTVAVRCRPFSQKELSEGNEQIISMQGDVTTINDPAGKIKPLNFTFDHSFWSGNVQDPNFASQEVVYKTIGSKLLENAFAGFNGCLFAYGQTGSGKTYSMLGYGSEKGVIPHLCEDLFSQAHERVTSTDGSWEFHVEVSYLEIYNEKCRCLLSPNTKQEYRVREHPVTGPYVENLTKIVVHSFEEIERIMEEGNKTRTVACTNMNATSSRSHAIFTLVINQATTHKELDGSKSEMTARLNLVDLAGSERADRTGATGKTLKEGSNINQSLTTLGKVINALAEAPPPSSSSSKDTASKKPHIPFRDSALTWILKENLCGNSKTMMLAAVSPAASNYEETVSTLRYADRAKNLRTAAVVNEDPTSKKIRELVAEVERLRSMLEQQQSSPRSQTVAPFGGEDGEGSPRGGIDYESMSTREKLDLAQRLMREESLTWTEREQETAETQQLRLNAMNRLAGMRNNAAQLQRELPSLVNLNEDPALSECLVYILDAGTTQVGRVIRDASRDVQLDGEGIEDFHASLQVAKDGTAFQIIVTPQSSSSVCFVNGQRLSGPETLHHNDRVIFGEHHFFRVNMPGGQQRSSTAGSGAASSPSRPMDFQRALEEKFQAEKLQFQQQQEALQREVAEQQRLRLEQEAKFQELMLARATGAVPLNGSFVADIQDSQALQQAQKLKDLEEKLKSLEEQQKSNLSMKYLSQTSVRTAAVGDHTIGGAATGKAVSRHADPMITGETTSSSSGGAASSSTGAGSLSPSQRMQNSLINAAHIAGARAIRLPNQQIFRQKLILLGHQEVGKTSLRRCFESDPLFFLKKLPDVKSTTGIETANKVVKVQNENVDIIISDFAGQEAYHSHTLFLTDRSVFALVWKISAVEQDFQSTGISEHEEKRLHRWIAEVYSKFPKAKIVVIATHLDELRDQSQKSVEMILNKVERLLKKYMDAIARRDPETNLALTNDLIGSFAVSCKQRTFIGAGRHKALTGGKISALLQVIADAAFDSCMNDSVFRCGAIPGRHIRLMQEIQEMKTNHPTKLLLPLSEYVHMAVRCGVESDEELLQISTLLHSWNTIFLFNPHRLSENVFIFLHPMWLCRLAGILFSYAHVLQTPPHLRSIIGGLEYSVTQAEHADMSMMKKGFLRLPLAKVLFRKALSEFLKREPEDADFDMCLQLLSALGLIEAVQVPCDDVELLLDETPGTPRRGSKVVNGDQVNRYFVPSLSPCLIPDEFRALLPVIFQRGIKVKFEFNMLPNEMWWRLQSRLQQHQQVITVRCPREPKDDEEDDDDDDDVYRLPEADDDHNRWRDAMWLKNESSRIMLVREDAKTLRFYSIEQDNSAASGSADELLKVVEDNISELLMEYRGIQRTIFVACPVPTCNAWHDVNTILPDMDVVCTVCRQSFPAEAAVISGVSPLGPHLFSAALHAEGSDVLSFALDDRVCEHVCRCLGMNYQPSPSKRPPPPRTSASSQNVSEDEEADLSRVNLVTSMDKVIRGVLLRQVWRKYQK